MSRDEDTPSWECKRCGKVTNFLYPRPGIWVCAECDAAMGLARGIPVDSVELRPIWVNAKHLSKR